MDKAQSIQYFTYLAMFASGLIIGRITMAIQYAVLSKSSKKDKKAISKKK